jgi:hypothetical protein
MAMRTDDRQRLRNGLNSLGYHHEYVDTWQPHVAMWWHKPQLNAEGVIVKPVGSASPAQPGHPDTQLRLSSRGLLPWRPNQMCMCSYCQARDWDAPIQQPNEAFNIATFPTLESFLVREPGRGMVLPPLHGVEQVKGVAKSASEMIERTRLDRPVKDVPVVAQEQPIASSDAPLLEAPSVAPVSQMVTDKYACVDCEFVANGARPTARASSLRAHRNKEHSKSVAA